jgi:hypothetical protein
MRSQTYLYATRPCAVAFNGVGKKNTGGQHRIGFASYHAVSQMIKIADTAGCNASTVTASLMARVNGKSGLRGFRLCPYWLLVSPAP